MLSEDFNIVPGLAIRRPASEQAAWRALREALSSAKISYKDIGTYDDGTLTAEIGE
jgi:hypothetical protein